MSAVSTQDPRLAVPDRVAALRRDGGRPTSEANVEIA